MKRVFIGIFILAVICFNSGCEFISPNSSVHFIADKAECESNWWGDDGSSYWLDHAFQFSNTEVEVWISKERLTIKSKNGQWQRKFKLSYNREKTYQIYHGRSFPSGKAYCFTAQSKRFRNKSEVCIEWDLFNAICITCDTYLSDEAIKNVEDCLKDDLKGKKLKKVTMKEKYIKLRNEDICNKLSNMFNQL